MPCNCDHLKANNIETELSKVACVLDELTGRRAWSKSDWNGYHPFVYCTHLSKRDRDEMVEAACTLLQNKCVDNFSLEVQMWWRDHQEEDRRRVEKEIKQVADDAARKIALDKLSPYERKLLGV